MQVTTRAEQITSEKRLQLFFGLVLMSRLRLTAFTEMAQVLHQKEKQTQV